MSLKVGDRVSLSTGVTGLAVHLFIDTGVTILEPRDQTIREVLEYIYGRDSVEFAEMMEHFGVSLDD